MKMKLIVNSIGYENQIVLSLKTFINFDLVLQRKFQENEARLQKITELAKKKKAQTVDISN